MLVASVYVSVDVSKYIEITLNGISSNHLYHFSNTFLHRKIVDNAGWQCSFEIAFNTLRARRNGQHVTDGIFNSFFDSICFFYENATENYPLWQRASLSVWDDGLIGSGFQNVLSLVWVVTLRWRHNGPDSVSNHQPRDCLLNRLFRRRSKKTPKLRVTGLCVGNSPGPVNSPHKGPVTRKMFPFDDVIMDYQ